MRNLDRTHWSPGPGVRLPIVQRRSVARALRFLTASADDDYRHRPHKDGTKEIDDVVPGWTSNGTGDHDAPVRSAIRGAHDCMQAWRGLGRSDTSRTQKEGFATWATSQSRLSLITAHTARR